MTSTHTSSLWVMLIVLGGGEEERRRRRRRRYLILPLPKTVFQHLLFRMTILFLVLVLGFCFRTLRHPLHPCDSLIHCELPCLCMDRGGK